MEVTSWGRARRARVLACRPERVADARAAVTEVDRTGATLVVHGAGRSYGDAALNDGGRLLLTERLDRIVAFDADAPAVVCEPGVTFRDLLEVLGPRGYLYPVSPGTAYTTLGGAVACDVHGKNQESAGSFGDHVEWIDLLLPDGEVRRTAPHRDPELFAATVGGLGLTGIVLRLRLRLVRTPSGVLEVRSRRMPRLDDLIEGFEACREEAPFSAGWIDGLARGDGRGRGILETARFADEGDPPRPLGHGVAVPFDFPRGALNGVGMRAFNQLYYRRVPPDGRTRRIPLARHLYPLDAVREWNRTYGKRGFHQLQCVLPDRDAPSGLRRILEAATADGITPFLGVLKTFGREGRGHLSFPRPGYTLALDFPHREGTAAVLRRLHRITLEHGGRVYLAKDSALEPELFRAMYPRHPSFRAVLERVDPRERLSSDLARRLELRR